MAIQVFIKERSREGEKFTATVQFDALGESAPLSVANPATPEQERELEWYFEEWLNFPFTDKARSERAAGSINISPLLVLRYILGYSLLNEHSLLLSA